MTYVRPSPGAVRFYPFRNADRYRVVSDPKDPALMHRHPLCLRDLEVAQRGGDDPSAFFAVGDDGLACFCLWEGCASLSNGNWIKEIES